MASDLIPGGPVHYSRLKKFRLSAAHYLADGDKATTSKGKGSATHSVLLGGKRVVVYEGGARNPKFEKYQEFVAANENALIVIPSEARDVIGMRRSIEAHPRALAILEGEREKLIEWDVMGRKCAGTPDNVRLGLPAMNFRGRQYVACDGKVGAELKTSKTSAPWSFPWEAKRYGYAGQCSWYKNGIEQCLAYAPGEVSDYFVVVVESTEPWPVTIFHYEERALNQARMEWRGWMDRLLECERTGQFPAYTDDDVSLGLDDDLDLDWDSDEEAA